MKTIIQSTLKSCLGISLFFLTYVGLAHVLVGSRLHMDTHAPIAMQSPLMATYQFTNYHASHQTNPFNSTPKDNSGYFQNNWHSTDPGSGLGYWSNGQWIQSSPTGHGYWHHGRWMSNNPADAGAGFYQFGTWVDTPEENSDDKNTEAFVEQPQTNGAMGEESTIIYDMHDKPLDLGPR